MRSVGRMLMAVGAVGLCITAVIALAAVVWSK
jgi:hypothetical protein